MRLSPVRARIAIIASVIAICLMVAAGVFIYRQIAEPNFVPYKTNTQNMLVNSGFEAQSTTTTAPSGAGEAPTVAKEWLDEHTTTNKPKFSFTDKGVVEGKRALRVSYEGTSKDTGKGMVEAFQGPTTNVKAGDVLVFSIYLSGNLLNAYGIIGVEAFSSQGAYISETDTAFTSLANTPVKYTVRFVCPPGTVAVAAYLQIPEVNSQTRFTVRMDGAILTKKYSR